MLLLLFLLLLLQLLLLLLWLRQRLLQLLVELNRMGTTILVATHDLNLIRAAKSQVQTRVLRISNRRLQLAGADL